MTPIKLKNVAPRAYCVNGKIIAPLGTFDVADEVTMASVKMHIGGDFEIVATESEADAPAKRGRKPKESTDAQEGGAE